MISKDEISSKEMNIVVDRLARIRNDFQCAVFVVHHFNKAMYDQKAFFRRQMRGSSVIEAAAESIIKAQRTNDGQAVNAYVTSKVSQDMGFDYYWKEYIQDGEVFAKLTA
jgi:RecA-family ATPase